VIQSIVFWLAAGVGVIFLVLLALAVFVIRAVSNFIQKEDR
jgi:Na+-transporting methylmalonyl-CoA/oxaloacetate decarboxylase gamma subunit